MVDYLSVLAPYDEAFIARIHRLCEHVFGGYGPFDFGDVHWALRSMPDVSVQTAVAAGELVGFKIGYASTPRRYYSFLGGVHEDHRRRGIALRLAQEQHRWAKTKGYTSIETGAINSNAPMIELNLSLGFRVIGSYCRADLPRITMFKEL